MMNSNLSAKTVGEETPYTSTHLHTALFLWPNLGHDKRKSLPDCSDRDLEVVRKLTDKYDYFK